MTVSCSDCRSVFRVDPAKVPATGVRARCAVCGGVIVIAGGTLPIAVTPASSNAALSAFATTSRAASGFSPTPPPSRGVVATPSAPSRPFATTPSAPTVVAVPVASTLMTPPTPASVSHRSPSPVASAPAIPVSAPVPYAVPAPFPANGGGTGSQASALGVPTPGVARKSINPFLNADPGQRARRLARALVSDLVAYHPQKQQDGLRDGTLRQLFREEIKKSYEEFVEQVGRDLAESSPHFQDALNEILGGGRKLF